MRDFEAGWFVETNCWFVFTEHLHKTQPMDALGVASKQEPGDRLSPDDVREKCSCGSPVFSRLLFEDHVAVVHPVLRGDVDPSMGVVLRRLAQHVVNYTLPVLPHVSQRPPHHIDGIVALPKEVLRLLQQQGDAGVRDHPQSGLPADVVLKSPRGGIVHPPDAGRAVDLRADALTQHLTRAGDDTAQLTVQLQRLQDRKQRGKSFSFLSAFTTKVKKINVGCREAARIFSMTNQKRHLSLFLQLFIYLSQKNYLILKIICISHCQT